MKRGVRLGMPYVDKDGVTHVTPFCACLCYPFTAVVVIHLLEFPSLDAAQLWRWIEVCPMVRQSWLRVGNPDIVTCIKLDMRTRHDARLHTEWPKR